MTNGPPKKSTTSYFRLTQPLLTSVSLSLYLPIPRHGLTVTKKPPSTTNNSVKWSKPVLTSCVFWNSFSFLLSLSCLLLFSSCFRWNCKERTENWLRLLFHRIDVVILQTNAFLKSKHSVAVHEVKHKSDNRLAILRSFCTGAKLLAFHKLRALHERNLHLINNRAVFKCLSKNQYQSKHSHQSQQEQTAWWTNQNS